MKSLILHICIKFKRNNNLVILCVAAVLLFANIAVSEPLVELHKDSIPVRLESNAFSHEKFSPEDIEALPVQSIQDILLINNGSVNMPQQNISSGGFHFRGGRDYDHGVFLNGVSFVDPFTGRLSATLNPYLFGELDLYMGGHPIEYGRGNSGLINMVTKPGTSRYSGMVEIISDNLTGSNHDQNWYTTSLSGPIPYLNRGKFFTLLERRWLGDRNPSSVTSSVLPGNPDQLPGNWQHGWSYHTRIDYPIKKNMSLTLTGDRTVDDWSEYRHVFLFDIDHTPRNKDKNLGLSAVIKHELSPATDYELSGSYFSTEHIQGDGALFDDLEAYDRGFANPVYDEWNLFRDTGQVDSYYDNFKHTISSNIELKGTFSRQVNRLNRLIIGVNYKRYSLRYFENLRPTDGANVYFVNRYGFDIEGNESDDQDYKNDTKHPVDMGFYLENRYDWKGLSLTAGVRYQRFDYNALIFKDQQNPLDPGNLIGIDWLEASDLTATAARTHLLPRIAGTFEITEFSQIHFNWGKYLTIPPFEYIYSGYDFVANLLINPWYFYPFPLPWLDVEKSTNYELGFSLKYKDISKLNCTFFKREYKDRITGWTQTAFPSQYDSYANHDYGTAKGLNVRLTTHSGNVIQADIAYTYSKVKGSEERTPYNINWMEMSDVNPLDYDQSNTITGNIEFDFDKGSGPIIFGKNILADFKINAFVYATSGKPYTESFMYSQATEYPSYEWDVAYMKGDVNSVRMPWIYLVDLKAERTFILGHLKVVPFVWVKNLFNRENITEIWTTTGLPNTTGWLDTEQGKDFIRYDGEEGAEMYRLKENDPTYYGPPRQIYFGIRTLF